MQKIDKTVIKETVYIAVTVLILSALMQSVFLILHLWDYTIILGNLLGYVAAVLNFFLMGLTVQKAVGLSEDDAKTRMKFSQMLRLFMLAAFALVAGIVDHFSLIAFVIPLLFPRIAIMFRPLLDKKK